MLTGLSRRLLTLLQLTRMALVFTAIADTQAALLLATTAPHAGKWGVSLPQLASLLHPWRMLTVAIISVGLYGFGMSLNDIIDRRRDRQISPGRPLPSGRVGAGDGTSDLHCPGDRRPGCRLHLPRLRHDRSTAAATPA